MQLTEAEKQATRDHNVVPERPSQPHSPLPMDVGEATSNTSIDVVKVSLENPVGLELEKILYRKKKKFFWKPVSEEKFHQVLFERSWKKPLDGSF